MTPPVDTVLSQSPVRCGAAALRATTGRQGDANSALLVERPCEIAMGQFAPENLVDMEWYRCLFSTNSVSMALT
jgi:hypothetical protein